MSGAYKWLGGLGYIFAVIPFLNFIAPVLVGLAWILMGRDTRNGVFTATGVLMIILLVIGAAVFLILPFQILPIMPLTGGMEAPPSAVFQMLQMAWLLIIIGVIAAVFGLIVFILELVSHFRAAAVFNNKWFKYAAWLRIIAVVIAVVMLVLTMAVGLMSTVTMPSEAAGPTTMFNPNVIFTMIFGPLIIAIILWVISAIFSAVAFFTIPERTQTAYPPPPPPE